jgi:hypothetical protein
MDKEMIVALNIEIKCKADEAAARAKQTIMDCPREIIKNVYEQMLGGDLDGFDPRIP